MLFEAVDRNVLKTGLDFFDVPQLASGSLLKTVMVQCRTGKMLNGATGGVRHISKSCITVEALFNFAE